MIYLDNSATTQVDEDVARAAFEAMTCLLYTSYRAEGARPRIIDGE